MFPLLSWHWHPVSRRKYHSAILYLDTGICGVWEGAYGHYKKTQWVFWSPDFPNLQFLLVTIRNDLPTSCKSSGECPLFPHPFVAWPWIFSTFTLNMQSKDLTTRDLAIASPQSSIVAEKHHIMSNLVGFISFHMLDSVWVRECH
jgi:hypothetical protein